ncbi:MAG: hypothetical protein HPAVJP_0780 [Candidatus Hepatoplasma vulgare]|nr:MAG: hypothetical protein HPAVJP_0780 [Candidatus Hepatoplasma sp.]
MKKEKILGLDIGVTSLGWAVGTYSYDEENNEPNLEIDDFGVRIWDAPEDSKTLETNAYKRRGFRSQRRLTDRRKQRIEDLKKIFYSNNLITKEEYEEHIKKTKEKGEYSNNKNINPLLLRYKGLNEKLTNLQLLIALVHIAKRRGYNNAFIIPNSTQDKDDRNSLERAKGLIEKYNYPIKAIIEDKHFSFDQPEKFMYRSKKINKDILGKKEKTELEKEKIKFYEEHQLLFKREDYEREYIALIEKQIEFNPIFDNLKTKIKNTIFRQRFFEDGPGPKDKEILENWKNKMKKDSKSFFYEPFTAMIGNCQFYPNEKRISNFSIEGDLSFITSETSKLFSKILENEKSNKENNLTEELIKNLTKKIILNYFDKIEFKRNFVTDLLKENNLEIPKMDGISFENAQLFLVKFNSIKDNNLFLKEHIKKINLENLSTITTNKINKIGKTLSEIKTPEKLKNALIKIDDFFKDKNDGYDWLRKNEKWITKGHKTLNTSSKFILDSLSKQINNGILRQKYESELNKKNNEEKIKKFKLTKDEFLKRINDPDMVKNAVVFRSINQTRKVVRKLFEKFNKFDKIIIEVAKDLYAEEKVRKDVKARQDKNEEGRKKAEEILIKNGINPSPTNISNYFLFKQQQITKDAIKEDYAINIYDINLKEKILLKDFFVNRINYDVDHIIPYSQYNDNTNNNKIITTKKDNNLKKNLTPLDYFEKNGIEKKKIENWKKEIIKFYKNKNTTKLEYLLKENINRSIESGFESRNINDTRYITKYIQGYFDLEFDRFSKITKEKKPEILTVQGGITSKFRKLWLKPFEYDGSLWGHESKPRDISPFHHAVDAMILINMISKQHIEFYQSIIRIFDYYNWLIDEYKKNNILTKNEIYENLEKQKKVIIEQLRKNNFNKEYKNDFFENVITISSNSLINYASNLDKLIRVSIYKNNFASKSIKPLIKNFPKIVNNLIPIKLIEEEKEIKKKTFLEPKFEKIIDIKDWAKLNNKSERDYPIVSYKINKKVRGNFLGSENPVNHKDSFEEGKLKKGFIKDNKNNIWDIRSYYGFRFNENFKLEAIFKHQVNEGKIKTLINRNVIFKINNEFEIYKYNGVASNARVLLISHPNLYYGNAIKFNKNFNYWPQYSKNIIKKINILNINLLGKIS